MIPIARDVPPPPGYPYRGEKWRADGTGRVFWHGTSKPGEFRKAQASFPEEANPVLKKFLAYASRAGTAAKQKWMTEGPIETEAYWRAVDLLTEWHDEAEEKEVGLSMDVPTGPGSKKAKVEWDAAIRRAEKALGRKRPPKAPKVPRPAGELSW